MKTYCVSVQRTTTYEVTVSASDQCEAEKHARETVVPVDCQTVVDTDVVAQLGEPWIYGWSGDDPDNTYYGRPDQYMHRSDLLIFKRATGNLFTKNNVALLIERARSTVGPVREHWNGLGSDSLTIQLVAPFGKLSDAQVAALMAPRGRQ